MRHFIFTQLRTLPPYHTPHTFSTCVLTLVGGYGAGFELLCACQTLGVKVHNAGIFASGVLVGGGHYKYAHTPPHVTARVERWKALTAEFGVSLPAAAVAFALMPAVVSKAAVGVKSPEEATAAVTWLHDANRVPAALWTKAKAVGLLPHHVPTPSEEEETVE